MHSVNVRIRVSACDLSQKMTAFFCSSSLESRRSSALEMYLKCTQLYLIRMHSAAAVAMTFHSVSSNWQLMHFECTTYSFSPLVDGINESSINVWTLSWRWTAVSTDSRRRNSQVKPHQIFCGRSYMAQSVMDICRWRGNSFSWDGCIGIES